VSGPGTMVLDPDGELAGALRVALEALEERATNSRWILEDTAVYGIADPDRVRRNLRRDEDASDLLRAALLPPAAYTS
jgi:hypothetical protein